LSTLEEGHADLQDKYDSLTHTTTQKLAAQAAELTARERQVDSLSTELHSVQEAATTHSAEVLRLQSTLDAQTTTQTDFARHQAEEASWSVLRTELTRQAEHSRQLEAAHSRAMTELNALRERHTAMEVLREEKRALERRAAAADELRETVVRLEAEVEAARAEREAWCVSLHPQISISNCFSGRRRWYRILSLLPPSPSRRACRCFDSNTRTSSKNMAQTAPRCVGAKLSSLMHRRAR
jgi:mitotic spindle assembly checkpoint protein MAD1